MYGHALVTWLLRRLPVLALALAPTFAVAQGVMEIITLRYRSAADVLPVIQPMLSRDGSATGLQNQIIVRTTPANFDEIRRIVAALDREPRRLVITVRDDIGAGRSRQGGSVSGSIGNDQARVQGHIVDTRTSGSERGSQTVQVLEGNSAYIRTGESRPVPNRQVVRTMVNGRIVEQVVDSTTYREAVTGLWVLPRINGDRVTMDLAPQREAFDNRTPGGVQGSRILTTVTGRLGEWIELGGVDRSSTFDGSSTLGRTTETSAERRSTWVMVEETR